MAYDLEAAERVRKLLSGHANVEEKKLMGGLCFMVDGHMCSVVTPHGGLLLRIGPDAMEAALAEPHAQQMEMRGRKMKGYVRVLPEGFASEARLQRWLDRALAFVGTLPPKS